MIDRRVVVGFLLLIAAGPFVAADPTGDLHVLSIGVEPSLSAKGKNDPYARDAAHMADSFAAAKPLFRTVTTKVVSGSEATHGVVVQQIGKLVQAVKKEDLAVIFFSCHGSWGPKVGYSISLAREKGKDGALHDAEFHRLLSRVKGKVIVLLDTCCAAGVLPEDRGTLPQVSFLVACQRDEGSSGSGPSKVKPHGCFVVAAVEALQGVADKNQDGSVTLTELVGYVPDRARELYNEQNAVNRIRPDAANLELVKVDPQRKPAVPEKTTLARNPFGMSDINRPLGADVREFARQTRFMNSAEDANAEAWATVSVPHRDNINGRWSGRWKTDGEWATGSAIIKSVDDRVFIMYHDGGSRYLIEARHNGPQRLVGRYVNLSDENDTTPWVGKIVDNGRIDGIWPGGRWDFRRGFRDGAE